MGFERMGRYWVLVLLFGWIVPAVASDPDRTIIDRFIAHQSRRERGEEYQDARKIASGDLNHDGTSDTAVLYTIEGQRGSNLYIQYLAVFLRRNGKLTPSAHAEVGGKGYRAVEEISVEENTIRLEILDYASRDAACCPSEKGHTRYVLAGSALQERGKTNTERK